MNEQETVVDIIAEKRRRAEEIERDCAEKMKRGKMVSDCFARELVATLRREADRLEAALKREGGDAAAMRKTLEEMATDLEDLASRDGIRAPAYSSIFSIYAEKCRKAIAAPARNCNVGTVEEQFLRWQAFCGRSNPDCKGCPCDGPECSFAFCFAKWAQMPYDEGGAK